MSNTITGWIQFVICGTFPWWTSPLNKCDSYNKSQQIIGHEQQMLAALGMILLVIRFVGYKIVIRFLVIRYVGLICSPHRTEPVTSPRLALLHSTKQGHPTTLLAGHRGLGAGHVVDRPH